MINFRKVIGILLSGIPVYIVIWLNGWETVLLMIGCLSLFLLFAYGLWIIFVAPEDPDRIER